MRLRGAPEVSIIVWGFLLNGAWEALQSPLYTDADRGIRYLLKTRLHCTVGDVLILLCAFLVTAIVFRTRFWMAEPQALPLVVFVALGLGYTTASEWFNTRVALSWAYSPAMPRLLGIGLAPLAQWIIVPVCVARLIRRAK